MDSTSGANPLGHSTILCFEQASEEQAPKLIDAYGGYSQPSSTTNLFIKSIKSLLGIKYDLQGTHSILRKENIWDLNQGGIRALHFEVSKEQFDGFIQSLKQQIENQTEVINELDLELTSKGLEINGANRYALEIEKNPDAPRLKPFHISSNFESKDSFLCKNFAIDLLHSHKIIDDKIKDQLLGSHFTSAFPINSNLKLSPVYLACTNGSRSKIVKNKQKFSYTWEESDFRAVFPLQNDIHFETHTKHLTHQLNQLRDIEKKLQEKLAVKNDAHLAECKQQILNVVGEFTQLSTSNGAPQLKELIDGLIQKSQKWIDISSYAMLPEDMKQSFCNWLLNHNALKTAFMSVAALSIGLALSLSLGSILPTVGLLIASAACLMLMKKIIELKSDYDGLQHSGHLYREQFKEEAPANGSFVAA